MPINIGNLSLKSRVYVPPMAGVTDLVFRHIVRRVDKHCMLATEMVSSRALMHRPETRLMDLASDERPIGIQIFGHEPDVMAQAAQMAEAKGADFIDINMGCPVPKITKGKDGCALMREPELAREIVVAVKEAIQIPLTVKFRLGWDDQNRNAVQFGQMLEAAGVCAVTVHGRTRQQLYSGQADWGAIAGVKRNLSIPVFGNGDVFEAEDAMRLLEETGCDGVAVARGTLGNPWLIAQIDEYLERGCLPEAPTEVERLALAYGHALGLIRYKGLRVGTNESRRHLTHYTKGIPGSAPFRARLTQVTKVEEIKEILGELALKVAGQAGLSSFLAEVENIDFAEGKEPAGWESPITEDLKAPVNV
ncbi:MAG: tRNA dihydrouridine synthase DusB [Candidatus Melainabacteria bacterium]|nr:MAG: tRNA dihydrouridine synthase DusB [Candidatus Melainabacteria bacterium]